MFEKHNSTVTLLIFGVKNSNPPRYAVYDTHNPPEARTRIELKHPEYVFLGEEVMFGKEEAKIMSASINKAMNVYPELLRKYPFKAAEATPGSALAPQA